MVDKTKKTTQARGKIAHKLAKYVRATPINLLGVKNSNGPSVSHLSNLSFYSALGGAQRRKLRNNAKTWYPADDDKTNFRRKRNQAKKPTGPKSIKAGQVVILLSGVHRGRRVVVLKTLTSGNLLVTGPFSVNGVPLKRVNSAYTIRTSTKVSVEGIAANIDDSFFKRQSKFTKDQLKHASEATGKKVESAKAEDQKWKEEAKKVQKTIDTKLIENIKKVEHLKGYLSTRFTLYTNTRPH
ncbi:UNVERIFIED_CONTAM: hypothetical protein GTU68_028434 [Idotea baltica]|nr:hypothetical protein [Idotea baltica]